MFYYVHGKQVAFLVITTASACCQPALLCDYAHSRYTKLKMWLPKGGVSKNLASLLIKGNILERTSSLSIYKLRELDQL